MYRTLTKKRRGNNGSPDGGEKKSRIRRKRDREDEGKSTKRNRSSEFGKKGGALCPVEIVNHYLKEERSLQT